MLKTLPSATEIKRAATDYPVHPLIEQRWSPRAFDDRAVAPAVLLSLFEAARWAPSGGNGQPWHFIVGRKGTPTHDKLVSVIKEGNLPWAAQAPVLMLTVAKMTTSSGRPHRHAFHDVGLAVANLTLQATAHDLSVHQLGGFEPRTRNLAAYPPPACRICLRGDVGTGCSAEGRIVGHRLRRDNSHVTPETMTNVDSIRQSPCQ